MNKIKRKVVTASPPPPLIREGISIPFFFPGKAIKGITLWLSLFLSIYLNARNTALAAELREIKRRGYLIVAVKDNLRPLGFRDLQGNLQGLEIDVARQLAKELLGREDAVKLQPVANNERLAVILENKADMAIARVTATSSRARLVDFSTPYYFDGTGIVTKNPSVQKLGDATTAKIAVLKGSSTIAVVKYILPLAQLVAVNSYQDALTLLETNQSDAFAADNSVLAGWVQENPQYQLLPVRLSGAPLSVVIPKGLQYNNLWEGVNNAINRWKANGWLQERTKYWGLPN